MKDKKTITQKAHNQSEKQFCGRENTKDFPSVWIYIYNLCRNLNDLVDPEKLVKNEFSFRVCVWGKG